MILKLTRDECRSIQSFFFPFIQERTAMKIRQETDTEQKLYWSIIDDQFHQVKKLFDRKLLTVQNNFTFSLTCSQGIIFYKLMMEFPIDPQQLMMIILRQLVLNLLYTQLPS